MKDARMGFPGDNVRIDETIENSYEIPYLDYVITNALDDLSVNEKFKIVRFMIRTFKKDYLFPEACFVCKKSDINLLLKKCEQATERLKSDRPHLKTPWIIR